MAEKQALNDLILEAINGKPQAQSKLMDVFWNDVKGYILIRTRDENLAEEITVETFTKAITKLHLYNEDFDFRTWLVSIAHNNIIDYYRKKKTGMELFIDDNSFLIEDLEPSPEEEMINKQSVKKLYKLIDDLNEKYKTVLQLRYFEDKSIKNIAQELNLTETNVKVRILRGKKLLLEKMTK